MGRVPAGGVAQAELPLGAPARNPCLEKLCSAETPTPYSATWEELRPDAVFQPSHHDVHQDHQTIAQEGLRAFKRTTVLGYEIPWNNFDFSYGAYVALEERHVERKVAALARYASQQHRRYANPEYVWNLARVSAAACIGPGAAA